ncbi:HDOD domain-containing protein [bacterium]|nr:HDOD domain-containing protein [bacterium]
MGFFSSLFGKKNKPEKNITDQNTLNNSYNKKVVNSIEKKNETEDLIEIGDEILKEINYKWESAEEIIDYIIAETTSTNKNDIKLIEYIVNLIDSEKIELPILPIIATKIIALSYNTKADFNDYQQIIQNDPVIALKVLKLANSPYYKGLKDVTDLSVAISRIGIDGLRELVLAISIKSKIFQHAHYKDAISNIWRHSLLSSLIASKLGYFLNISPTEAYTTALLHDVGQIVVYHSIQEYRKFYKMVEWPDPFFVSKISTSIHMKLSAFILNSWNFSMQQIDSVRVHHIPPTPVSSNLQKNIFLSTQIASTLLKNSFQEDNTNILNFLEKYKLSVKESEFNKILLRIKNEFESIEAIF